MSKKGPKSSKAEVQSYEIGDTVLGKIRGYPPWPGRIVDPENLPEHVTKERPVNRKTLSYCIQFFPAGDYSWIPAKDISRLKPHEVETYISDPGKRNGELLEGYKIARDPGQWIRDLEDAAAIDAEAEADEEDQLEDEGEIRPGGKKKKAPAASTTKKRKRESEPGTKPNKASASTSKGKGSKPRKSKAAVESEDDEAGEPAKEEAAPATKKAKTAASAKDEPADDDELAKDPEATKVREWRHRLQKIFLSSKSVTPKPEEMPDMDALFTQIERYDKINIAYLSFSKIGKVMRHITALPDEKVPLDSDYKFRDRARVLVEQWQQIINASRGDGNSSGGGGGKNAAPGSSPTGANGLTSKTSPNGAGSGSANETVNGIADAINTSIASGPIEINGHHGDEHGHVNGSE
ncbi:hypothetical protein GYMLUDRAFT_75195 [Collybiopsis luxurians FD-317 M1]|uniref:PWWP domain-containing protein n=1 Tax=Collybiopsis luxurians FD-317 M1 TaxID=944289 RepID=A0A0D0C5V0_9AGAR|nr:hypothetical protein GYMLUDRAFT_75195 [Collybiopsis luxurians FD-317 M1]